MDGLAGITIKRSDRAFFVGATGSGKSVLARKLSDHIPYLVVVDPKHEWKPGPLTAIVTSNTKALLSFPPDSQIIYRPTIDDQEDGLTEFWDSIWKIKNVIVLLDELVTITKPVTAPKGLRRAIQMGRSRGIGVWGITQRPAWVPKILMSEAQHFFVGRLSLDDDRKRMAELMQSPDLVRKPIEQDFDFWYGTARGDGLRKVRAEEVQIS